LADGKLGGLAKDNIKQLQLEAAVNQANGDGVKER